MALRGNLAGDRELLARAEQAWLDHPRPPAGDVHTLYAHRSPVSWGDIKMVAVALAAADEHGRTTVAWVTTALSAGEPDTGLLRVRSIEKLTSGRRAIGFVAATPGPGDRPLTDGGGVAVALSAPGVENVRVEPLLPTGGPPRSPETGDPDHWVLTAHGGNAWNTVLFTDLTPTSAQVSDPAPSVDDPPARSP